MAGIIVDGNKLGGVPQSASKHVAMSTCFDVLLNSQVIGFISQITLGHTRTVTQIRHLNSVDAGIAVDTVVTPDAVTLNFSGFYVYKAGNDSSAPTFTNTNTGPTMGRVAGGAALLMTLDQQNIPIDIVVRHAYKNVNDATDGTAKIIGVYKNCTIQSMSIPIVLTTAAVSDNGVLSVGYVASGLS
jgi:hypothetical protein